MNASTAITRRPAVIFLVLIAFAIATSALWTPGAASAQSTPIAPDDLRTITVEGTGIVATTPDTADVTLGMFTTDESLTTAQTDISNRLETLTQTVTELGVDAEDISTSSYNIRPIREYDRNDNLRGISGYEVSASLRVTVRDLDLLGTVLEQATDAGVNDIWGISMYVDDTEAAANQARQAAMADARERAEEFARAEGLLITGVYSIVETSAPAPPTQRVSTEDAAPASMDADMAEASSVPISPGSTNIRVDVNVIYIIEQGNG